MKAFYILGDDHETALVTASTQEKLTEEVRRRILPPGDPAYAENIAEVAWREDTAVYDVLREADQAPLGQIVVSSNPSQIEHKYQERIADARNLVREAEGSRRKMKAAGQDISFSDNLYQETLKNLEEHEAGHGRFKKLLLGSKA